MEKTTSSLKEEKEKTELRTWLAEQPLLLEREDLRIVHAAWLPPQIEHLEEAKGESLTAQYRRFDAELKHRLQTASWYPDYLYEQAHYAPQAENPDHAPPPMPRARPALDRPADFQGVSLRFLGGHDAGRLLIIDRPIVSIRNGCGQVAVVTNRNGNFFVTHVEGSAYPMVNGESIGLGAHPLRNHDLIELSGTIIQFSQSPAGSQLPSGPTR